METALRSNGPTGQTDWESQPPVAIIEFILTRFHDPLRRDLPGLVERAREVEAAERGKPLAPVGLAEHLEQVRLAVEDHLAKEEKILFPLILAGRGSLALMPIRVMMSEHGDHLHDLARTRHLTHDFTLPETASARWQDLYQDLQGLEDDLNQHIGLEDNVLFTRAIGAAR